MTLDRRTLLGTLGAGLAGLAGCTGSSGSESTPTSDPAPAAGSTPTRSPTPGGTATDTPTEAPPPPPETEEPAPPAPDADHLRLLSTDAPERAPIGETVRYRFTVENAGEDTELVEPTVSSRSGGSGWTVHDRWVPEELAPGARTTFESDAFTSEYRSTVELRIDGFDETFEVEFEEKRLRFERPYRDPIGREVTVEELRVKSSYEYERDGYRRVAHPGDGLQWVLVTVEAVNRTDDRIDAPALSTFSLRSDQTEYRPIEVLGETAFEPSRLPPGSRTDGRIAFKTPDALTRADFLVAFEESYAAGDVEVVWTPE